MPISYAKTDAEIAEERRLFYVALTRAERELTLTWPASDAARNLARQRSRFLDLLEPKR
jgi:DNA helicase-2/ATP-dependent DNA helicase PcrA